MIEYQYNKYTNEITTKHYKLDDICKEGKEGPVIYGHSDGKIVKKQEYGKVEKFYNNKTPLQIEREKTEYEQHKKERLFRLSK